MQRATPHSLHIAQATDWKEAVITLLEPRSPYRPWRYGPSEAREGDTVAFVLNTDPPSVVTAVAQVGPDGNHRSAVFDPPMSDLTVMDLTTLAATVGLDLNIALSWQFDAAEAAKLEGALHECRYLFAPESRFGHSSVCQVRTLLRSAAGATDAGGTSTSPGRTRATRYSCTQSTSTSGLERKPQHSGTETGRQ
jgi:hypothetical protein